MHDDFVRNPPKNVIGSDRSSLRWTVEDKDAIQGGVLGQEVLGRIKYADVESELVEESAVHS